MRERGAVRSDQERWNSRYRQAETGPPRSFLMEVAPVLPETGRALDLACGTGSETRWLAERGLLVDAIDIAEAGLAVAQKAIEAAGLGHRVRLMRADLDHGVPAECPGPYQLICALHFRADVVEQAIVERLAPEGMVVLTRLSVVSGDGVSGDGVSGHGVSGDGVSGVEPTTGGDGSDRSPGHQPDPAFLARPGELLALAARCDLEVLEHREGHGQAALLARRRGVDRSPAPG